MCVMLAQGDTGAAQQGWHWAEHGNKMANPPHAMYRPPRQGNNNDNAHPPIHPTQYARPGDLHDALEKNLYEFICRSFLACAAQMQ